MSAMEIQRILKKTTKKLHSEVFCVQKKTFGVAKDKMKDSVLVSTQGSKDKKKSARASTAAG